MTDDDRMRRLLSDAVSDIEPHDRIADIRASVHPDPQVVPMTRPRPWLYALGGAVASAAVIGVIAYTTNALSGPDDGSNGLGAGQGSVRSSAPTATATATDPDATPSSPATSSPGVTTGAQAYAVYYVGANGAGKPVLYREWHRGPRLPAADPGGKGRDVLGEAVHDAMATSPLDADYRTPWRDVALLDHARYVSTGAGATLQIALRNTGIAKRPASMSAAEARAAVQQLVYTAQAAIGKRAPVLFTVGRKGHGPTTLLGVDISKPIANGPVLRTLSLVNISSPNEGDRVSGPLKVTGVNNAFEGASVVYLERNGTKYLVTPATGGFGFGKLYPWSVTLDTSKVAAGRVHPRRRERRPVGPGPPRQRHPEGRGQVAQRAVRDSRAATATTPAVEVRSTSSPRRTACAPAAAKAATSSSVSPPSGPTTTTTSRRPGPRVTPATWWRPRAGRPPGRPRRRGRTPGRSSSSAPRVGTTRDVTAWPPRARWSATERAPSPPARRARPPPTVRRPTGRRSPRRPR